MTLNVTSVVLFVTGVILIYAGVKNMNPRDVLTNALSGKSPDNKAAPASQTTPVKPLPTKPTYPSV